MKRTINRRDFMVISGSAVAVMALPRCSDDGGETNIGTFSGGNVSDYAVGDVNRFDEGPFFVGLDDDGLYAMTAVCTHQGCTVDTDATNLSCPCHGATYDLGGAVLSGPAPASLEHYEVTVDDNGDITVNTGQIVSDSTRTV